MKDKVIELRKPKSELPILNCIKERFSPRVFSECNIPNSEIELMIEAARLAPSARNHQPWKFFIIRKESNAFEKFKECIPERNNWCFSAAVFFIATFDPTEPKDVVNKWCKYDLGAACVSLILQAQELGYYSRQIGSFDTEKAKDVFDIEDPYQPFVIIPVGKIGEDEDYNAATQDILEKEMVPWERREKIFKVLD